jgi:hypothetical protein
VKQSIWRERENALIWGAPLAIVPALSVVPVTVSFLLYPTFRWARLVGTILTLVLGFSIEAGISRLALTLRRDFDALTFFAAGVVITMWVILACSGVLLAIVLTN